MADVKISGLPASTVPLAGTEVLPIVQGGTTKQVSIANVTAGRAISATTLQSTIATGTAPLTVASTTEVANLRSANATSADTANQVKSNATSGVLQVVGPTATTTRIMTTPDANFNVARTDAAQSFTGNQTLTDGNLIVSNGKGIDFSATPGTGTSELLNDYEEGTWTAVIKGFTTAGVYETQNNNCTYQKIGNRCFVQARIRMAGVLTGGGVGFAVVAGLPFSKSADSLPVGSVYFFGVAFVGNPFVGFYTFGSSSELYFGTNITLSDGNVDISGIGINDLINFNIDYQVG